MQPFLPINWTALQELSFHIHLIKLNMFISIFWWHNGMNTNLQMSEIEIGPRPISFPPSKYPSTVSCPFFFMQPKNIPIMADIPSMKENTEYSIQSKCKIFVAIWKIYQEVCTDILYNKKYNSNKKVKKSNPEVRYRRSFTYFHPPTNIQSQPHKINLNVFSQNRFDLPLERFPIEKHHILPF